MCRQPEPGRSPGQCGDLPARHEAWQDPSLAGDANLRSFQRQLERVAPWPMVPEWEQIAIRLQEQAERAARGGAAPDSVLSDYDRDVDRMLEKRRWLAARRLNRHSGGSRGPG